MKTCKKCGVDKPYSEYSKHKLGKGGLRPRCKSCTAEDNAAYRARTIEQRAEYNKRYRQENREQHLAYNNAWNKANRDRMREAYRRYRKNNPAYIYANRLRHKARDITNELGLRVQQRVELYGGRCYYCKAEADTLDHRIPICRGGLNLPANLVPACRSCNSRKRHRTESEWREVVSLYRAHDTPFRVSSFAASAGVSSQ